MSQAYRLRKNLPKLLLGLASTVLLLLLAFSVNRFSLIILPEGESQITLEVGTPYSEPGIQVKLRGSLILRDGFSVDADIVTDYTVDTSRVGTYQILYQASFHGWDCAYKRTVHVTDTHAPCITLNAIPGSYTLPGYAYEEEGFCAWDAYEGDLTAQVIREERDGFIYYRVSDSTGNTTCVSRKIRYLDPVPPEIRLTGDSTIYLKAGTAYQEPGWTALDNCDGNLTERVQAEGTVDVYMAGTYEIHYSVADQSGNSSTVVRTVVVEPIQQPDTVTPSGKVIYLTFDDGPGPYTAQLLEILDKYNVKATFFVINSDYVGLISEIAAGGHALGVHSITHDYRGIYCSAEAYIQDLYGMQEIIYRHSGVETFLMRFPGGSSNTVSRFNKGIMTYLTQAVENLGFRYFDWNVDSNDAGGAKTAEEVFENITKGVRKQDISVVLQHDVKDFSVEAVEKILIWGMENGYVFLPLDMTSPTAHHGVNN